MGSRSSHHAQEGFPAGSPANIMVGLHGPKINCWSPTWHKETKRLHLPTWPLHGSFLPEKLGAVRTMLLKAAGSKKITKQLAAFTLWAEQALKEWAKELDETEQQLEKQGEKVASPDLSPSGYTALPVSTTTLPSAPPGLALVTVVALPSAAASIGTNAFAATAPEEEIALILPLVLHRHLSQAFGADHCGVQEATKNYVSQAPPQYQVAVAPSQYLPASTMAYQRPRRDQCAYCKQCGHWKKNCPIRPPLPPWHRAPVHRQVFEPAPPRASPAPHLREHWWLDME